MKNASTEYQKGLLYALGCYLSWGLFPLYWYPVTQSGISADQILAQRILWSAVFSAIMLLSLRKTSLFLEAVSKPRVLLVFVGSAFAILLNWLVYLWSITNHHVLDASLGYFIAPLVNILFGYFFFKEKLNRIQIIAVLLAVIGVLWLAILAGHLPWVSLILAFSFGLYGLLRKLAPIDPLSGMTLETLIMLPFALGYLVYVQQQGSLVFSSLDTLPLIILIGSGVVTVVPLLMFAVGVKRISLADLGMIQYVSPTMQFILGLTLFNEAFNVQKFIGYLWVWLGIMVYVFGVIKVKNQNK